VEARTEPYPAATNAGESRAENSALDFVERDLLDTQFLGENPAKLFFPDLHDAAHRRPPPDVPNPMHAELFDRVIHPYNSDEFDRMLKKHNLHTAYPQLVKNLTLGFPLGRLPILERTVIIENHDSVRKHADVVGKYIEEEVSKDRMSGPFSRTEMEAICRGPFYCSPMIVVEQEQGPGEEPKRRVCRHLSKDDKASGTPSVNSFIDKADFPTRFDFALDVAKSVGLFPLIALPPRPRSIVGVCIPPHPPRPRRPWRVHPASSPCPRRPWHVQPASPPCPRRPWHAHLHRRRVHEDRGACIPHHAVSTKTVARAPRITAAST
jgi:hypothetical protein